MRFQTLGFRAFGPFTGLDLDLVGGAPGGFHLVLGPNEAGKSSALRGVHDLLFGFPERTLDAHVHPSNELRIAAVLADADGHTLEIQRLKRRKDSLRDGQDAPIDESVLTALLGGVTGEVFERLFGLDHERLARAGQALLNDNGDVGESLFDAGSGGPGIRRVRDELRESAEQIFKPRASKASLNVLLEGYKQAKVALRDAQVFPEKWQAQSEKLEAERKHLDRLSERRKQLREESSALTRLSATLGPIAQRNAFRDRLASLGPLPALADDARERRERAERTLERVERDALRLERERAKKLERSTELNVPEALLALSVAQVNQLRDRVGDFRKAERDLPRRREEVRRWEEEAMRLARSLYPEKSLLAVETMRPRAADIAHARRLLPRQAALLERVQGAQRAVRTLELTLAQTRTSLDVLAEPGEVSEKRRVLALARGKTDLERQLRDAEARYEQLSAQASSQFSALGRWWRGELARLPQLAVPSEPTVERFAQELAEFDSRRRAFEREDAGLVGRLESITQQVRAIEGLGSVPSEEQLDAARRRRDDGFERLIAGWGKGQPPTWVDADFSPGLPLFQGVSLAIRAADEQADRLRREAERVSTLAQLGAERERLERERAQLQATQLTGCERQREVLAAWNELWSGLEIEPQSPGEMRAWLTRQRALSALVLQANEVGRGLNRLRDERQELVAELSRVLGRNAAASLSELVAACEGALESGVALTNERKQLLEAIRELERQLAERQDELAAARVELTVWESEWVAASAPFGFGRAPSTEEMTALLDAVSALFGAFDELIKARGRRAGMEQDAAAFASHVDQLICTYAPDLAQRAPDAAAQELVERFQRAELERDEKRKIAEELGEMASASSALQEEAELAHAEIDSLRRAAGATELSSLVDIETKCREAKALAQDLETVERSLVLDEGVPLEALLAAASGAERPALQVRQREIEEELERLDEEIQNVSAEVRDLDHGLARYAESDAADCAQRLSEQAAEIRDEVGRYARFKLASVVIAREIERYREQNQGPVLRRANAIFPRLTLDRYRGLRVGLEERRLFAVREDNKEVGVDGLSEGTRYQLYLALRIASLERYLERNPPLPLVLDDILIHFDDDRARAALAVLGELAARVQILFFTHHARDRELAAAAIPESRLFNHGLAQAR